MATTEILTFHFSCPNLQPQPHPNEDFLLVRKNVYAVFDGVTLLHQNPYPDPSPAREAAEIGAETVIEVIYKEQNSCEPDLLLKKAFELANQNIREYNRKRGITPHTVDHLQKQYAAAVGAFGYLKGTRLHFAQITDCGVMILDQAGKILSDSVLDRTPFELFLEQARQKQGFLPGSQEEHVFVRSQVVNNSRLVVGGRSVGLGVINGEKQASLFLRTGSVNLHHDQVAVFYSDGFIPMLQINDLRNKIVQSYNQKSIVSYIQNILDKPENDGWYDEKTMICIKINEK